MAPSSSSSAAATSVQVALRIRPPTNQDSSSIPVRFQRSVIQVTSPTSINIEPPSAALANTGASTASANAAVKKQPFTFDQVHGPPTTQYEMFETTAKPLITRFTDGFNCTILAYGQTSSGKTFTMTGVDLDADPSDPSSNMGIIPRAVSSVFVRANQLKEEKAGAWTYNIKASFIEIYNEDLIDLLSIDDLGGKRDVQIREDKHGHIIWDGLREVNVRNSSEVMGLLRKGTSIRRTNETDMNAQSSRSHAIFSLTLTQKKYSGSVPPARSHSPLPPGGRSPSRLARPGSMYSPGVASRVASPPLGRPSTPSFASAMQRGGLRPASALGHSGDRAHGDDEAGEWITITSKFHFVDLAGSERLKRTAAQGERIKEGISINSGLLALGNVISALGDPSRAKSNTATYIPYRDSKLTRLLQDSLGGNAHTLMIACVSPAEWNAGETLNTLKYANRARNIKNRAVVNEREDGWDDVEWLQNTILRLRKEMKALKDGGAISIPDRDPDAFEGASKRMVSQMSELQNNYEDLRAKYVDRTEELTRLRGELGEKQCSSTGGTIGGTAKYEEIVGPVIEEYEKTISAMEAELSLNRAALRHTNDLVEEKEEELAAITERHSATDMYVEELRNRVAKLSEREASTEAYIRDLEEKLRNYDETSTTSSESLNDLKKELSRHKDVESHSSKYIADLEARLAKSDESILGLQQTVETLERECDHRRLEVEALKSRLEAFTEDGENWRTDLEERESRVKLLEEKMEEWERKKNEAGEARARLGEVVDEVVLARKSLEVDMASLGSSQTGNAAPSSVSSSPPSDGMASYPPNLPLESQLLALQQTHTATLADLSSITSKYRDALREISDLAAQIHEAKISNSNASDVDVVDSPATDNSPSTPSHSRRRAPARGRESVDVQPTSGRRLFFRQAASTESLHARSLSQSQSLSQELSSVHTRKTSFSSQGTSSSHSRSSSQIAHSLIARPNLSISMPSLSPSYNERSVSSLEKEIMRLQEVLKEREADISILEESLKASEQRAKHVKINGEEDGKPYVNGAGAGALSNALSPRTLNQFDHIRKTMENGNGHALHSEGTPSVQSEDDSLERLNELMLSMAQKESQHRETLEDLNAQLADTRRQLDELTVLSRDQTLNMSTELEVLRGKHDEDILLLEQVQQREVDLIKSLDEAKSTHAAELEQLRLSHKEALNAKSEEVEILMVQIKQEHASALSTLRAEQESLLAAVTNSGKETETLVARLTEEHQSSITSLHAELEMSATALQKAREDHEAAFGALKEEHNKVLHRQVEEAKAVLQQTKEEHEKLVAKLQAEHVIALRSKEETTASAQQATEEEYYNALTKLRGDHAEAIKQINQESAATIERLREEHASALKMADIAREGSLNASESFRDAAIKELQGEHAAAIARKDASFAEECEVLKAALARDLASKEDNFRLQLDRLRLEHETTLSKIKLEHRDELERSSAELASERDQRSAELSRFKKELEESLQTVKEQQVAVLGEVEKFHEEELGTLKANHQTTIQEITSKLEQQLAAKNASHSTELEHLHSTHAKEADELRSKLDSLTEQYLKSVQDADDLGSRLQSTDQDLHQATQEAADLRTQFTSLNEEHRTSVQAFEDLRAQLSTAVEDHRRALDQANQDHHRLLEEEKTRYTAELEASKARLAQDQDERDTLVQELEAQKFATEKFSALHQRSEKAYEEELGTRDDIISTMQQQLNNVGNERDDLDAEVAKLRAELARTRGEQSRLVSEASKRESVVVELERYRSILAETQENLQKVKDEKDILQTEKNRSDILLKELQAQVARSASPPNVRSPDRGLAFSRGALPSIKLPPPTPPPTVPPPPAPRGHANGDSIMSTSSQSSSAFYSSTTSTRDSQLESPSTSVGHMTPLSLNGFAPVDPKVTAKLEEQTKQLEEQEAMIKTLNKQLTHCESDLQTHMDLVAKLEGSLGDSEKNLRKARMQATELARERDILNTKVEQMRNELTDAQREVVTVRRSVVEEKQSLEQRLDEERKAKERVRQQLDSRMEELQRRKSKFACL